MSFHVRGPAWPVAALALAAVVFYLGFPVSTQGPGRGRGLTRVNGRDAAEGEVLLKYRDERARPNHLALEAAADADTVEALDRRGVRRLRSRRLRTAELLSLLATDPDVEYAEPNYVVRLALVPNDPSFTSLWGLFNTGFNPVGGGGLAGKDIDAPAAWDITTGSRANVVAIFDTGVDYTHPDLAANMWSAPAPFQVTVGGVTISCQAGTHGFNAIARTCDPMDDHYHGTHVAGTIGAVGHNGVGVAGVNWIASMMAIKFMGPSGSGYISDAVLGMDFVTQAKAAFAATRGANVRVLSNSWGGGYSTSLLNTINAANDNDMLFVAAAGNNNTNNDTSPHYPSSYPTPNMVAVASSDSSDQRSGFSNYGASTVHLAAPGSAILSTVPGNSYASLQGTSMATPHVAGAAALALSMCAVSTTQLKSLLLGSVDPVPAFSGITTTGGRLNVRAAVQNCPYPKVTSLTLTPSVASPQALGTAVTWTAMAGGGQGPRRYRWYVWDGATWVIAQTWSTANTFTWTPTAPNASYQVLVQVRSAWNTAANEFSIAKPFAIMTPVSSATLTTSLTAPQYPGTTITWTASAAGGQAPYQYQFAVWDGVAWTVTRPWSTANTYAWTPVVADPDYKIVVQVRSAWNPGANEVAIAKPFAVPVPPVATSVTLNANMTAPQLPDTNVTDMTVTWTASASGGQAPYQYQFAVWDGLTWTVTRPWGPGSSYAWSPTVANADYRIVVQARSAWNPGTSEIAIAKPFPILPAVSGVTLTPNVASPRRLGDTVTFTAAASGGQGPYQYQFRVWQSGWTVAQSWSTSNLFAWAPTVANSYNIQVQVRSGWSTGAPEREATLQNYSIRTGVTSATLTPSLLSPRPSGTTIRWTASATGDSTVRYQWVVFDGSTWINTTGLTTNSIFDWTPTVQNASYQVAIRVWSSWNTGAPEFTVIQPFVVQ